MWGKSNEIPRGIDDGVKLPEKKDTGKFLSEFLTGSHREIALGLGALVLLMSSVAFAKDKIPVPPDKGRARVEAQKRPSSAEVEDARSAFIDELALLQANAKAREQMAKVLDETLGQIETPSEQLEVIEIFRAQLERRVEKKEHPEWTVQFDSAHAMGSVTIRFSADGSPKVESDLNLKVGVYEYAKGNLLKPNFMDFYKGGDKNNPVTEHNVIMRVAYTLVGIMEAEDAAEAQGKKDAADALGKLLASARAKINGDFGDILK